MSKWSAESSDDYYDEFWLKSPACLTQGCPEQPRPGDDICDTCAERRRYESTGVGGSLETRIERFRRRMGHD